MGARRFWKRLLDADDSEIARLSVGSGKGSPSDCESNNPICGTVDVCMSGEEEVRYPVCERCVVNGGGVSADLSKQQFELETCN